MMGTVVSADDALRLLRKYNGDMERTATALIEGETGGELITMDTSWSGGPAVGPRTPPRKCVTTQPVQPRS